MESLLNNNNQLDLNKLDTLVSVFYNGKGQEQIDAGNILTLFQENLNSWQFTDMILQNSNLIQTKFIALSILDNLINTRWNILPTDQQTGIRDFIIGMILSLCNDSSNTASALPQNNSQDVKLQKELVKKADLTLVQIIKKNWSSTLINELIESSKSSNSICENNLHILKLIAEEIFDYSEDKLTRARKHSLRKSLTIEFEKIFRFCIDLLSTSNNKILQTNTIETVLRYINWLPFQFIYDSQLLHLLTNIYILWDSTRLSSIKCLIEIANIQLNEYTEDKYKKITVNYFRDVINLVNNNIFPLNTQNINEFYETTTVENQNFLEDWAIFLCNYLTNNRNLLEVSDSKILMQAHEFVLNLSTIDEKEIFKIVLEYWHNLVHSLFLEIEQYPFDQVNPLMSDVSMSTGAINPLILKKFPLKRNLYEEVCSKLIELIIKHMVKPEEVFVVQNEFGEFVKQIITDSDDIQLYENERDVLVYLTHLNVDEVIRVLNKKLVDLQNLNRVDYNDNFNKVCWTIGAIAGTMRVESEQDFVMKILQQLWSIFDTLTIEELKTVYSTNTMFIVGQYPRFLKNHWKFFQKVIYQLFNLMHDPIDAIRDMACNTFLKLTKKCQYQMATVQHDDENNEPMINGILNNLKDVTTDLNSLQLQTFYEACGTVISNESDYYKLKLLVNKLMKQPNLLWETIVAQFRINSQLFNGVNHCQSLINLIRLNIAVSDALKYDYFEQIQLIYLNMLDIYSNICQLIQSELKNVNMVTNNANNGNIIMTPKLRMFKSIKKLILTLMTSFIDNTRNHNIIILDIIEPLFNVTLEDYANSLPDLREVELLGTLRVIVDKVGYKINGQVIKIMHCVFSNTINMINKDLISFPEFRVELYKLLKSVNEKNFDIFNSLPLDQFKLFIDSICWSLKHLDRNVSEIGLMILPILLIKINMRQDSMLCNLFYEKFYLMLINEIWNMLTQLEQRATFEEQSDVLLKLINSTVKDEHIRKFRVNNENEQTVNLNNKQYLLQYLSNVLYNEFKDNASTAQIETFLQVLFNNLEEPEQFQLVLKDFLIQIREIGSDPNEFLFLMNKELQIEERVALDKVRQNKNIGLIRETSDVGSSTNIFF